MKYLIIPDSKGSKMFNGQRVTVRGFADNVTIRTSQTVHTTLNVTDYVAPAAPPLTARQLLAEAERTGIDVTVGETTYRLRCAESDRSAFAQRAALILTAQEFMTAAQKTAHRATPTVIVDAAGTAHVITVGQYQQLVLAYGTAYEALWAAANPVT